jgi:hypothetical protein
VLARQALYFLSHSSSHFCSGYFGDRDSLLFFVQAGLDCNPPILHLPAIARMIAASHHTQPLVETGSHVLFVLARAS